MWGNGGSGKLPRRVNTWADSWTVITDFPEEKMETGTPDRIHNICECINKWKKVKYFGKAENKVNWGTESEDRKSWNLDLLRDIIFGKLSFDSHSLWVNTENCLIISFVFVIYSWWIGRPGVTTCDNWKKKIEKD